MKKSQVDEILTNQKYRRNTITSYICILVILVILSMSFILLYAKSKEIKYVTYKEDSNIDYNVYLKENDIFEHNYLGKGNRYIASLIDYIDAMFEYNLSLDKDNIDYKYSYRIEATVNVKEKNSSQSLFNKTETIKSNTSANTNNQYIQIREKVNIDYNKYNDWTKNFVNLFELNDAESTLTINMYINVLSTCEEFEQNESKESVMTLSIPLTTKTMAIDISNNLINSDNNVMLCKTKNATIYLYILMSSIFVLIALLVTIKLFKFISESRTAENIYEHELKKILNNYKSYIQKVNTTFDLEGYQVLPIDTFTDMLEIRDTIGQPILMVESKQKNGAYFIIPCNTKILYMYCLKVSDIQNKLDNQEKNNNE